LLDEFSKNIRHSKPVLYKNVRTNIRMAAPQMQRPTQRFMIQGAENETTIADGFEETPERPRSTF
jgi:hypothetical protein